MGGNGIMIQLQEMNEVVVCQDKKKKVKETLKNIFVNPFKKEKKQNSIIPQIENQESQIQENDAINLQRNHCQQPIAFIIHNNDLGQLVLTNAIFIDNDWDLIDFQQRFTQSNLQEDDILDFEKFASQIKGPNEEKQRNGPPIYKRLQLSQALSFGTTFGQCLANINEYKDTNTFLMEFGKTVAVNTSLCILLTSIPSLKTLLLVGGLSYYTLSIYINETQNTEAKLKKTGKFALATGSGLGGTMGGIALGQALIPIPIFGALVGGIAGGYLGTKTSDTITAQFTKKKTQKMMKQVLVMQDQITGGWVFTNEYEEIYGVTNEFLMYSIPQELVKSPSIWITFINYFFLSVCYGQQEQLRQQQIQKQKEKKQKEKEKQEQKVKKLKRQQTEEMCLADKAFDMFQKFEEQQQLLLKYQNEQEILESDSFQWPDSIIKVQEYIQNNNLSTLEYSSQIENWVLKVISDI